ncbi:class I tRNA ligase family protein [Nonomuraea sp. NPDC049709]|uniref:class I tRNA ligase family protein n=1 Tax=Nonomuraea sp. NPDC049709 TaxID=3154736 RepID=UPI0034264A6D
MRDDVPGGLTVLVSPPPTPNGPLHVGHLSGPYVAADVAARAARARGERVLTICGTDDHQNYVPAKARALGLDPDKVISDYGTRIAEVLKAIRVDHHVFTSPRRDHDYRRAVTGLLDELVEAGVVVSREHTLTVCGDCRTTLHHAYVSGACPACGAAMGGGTCEGCGGYAAAADLVDPVCTVCGGPPVAVTGRRLTLPLEDHRETLTGIWSRAVIPARCRALLGRHLDEGLPDIPVCYPSDWGIEVRGGQRLDVWFEMGLAYLYAVGRAVDPRARTMAQYAAAWQDVSGLWAFLGLDNAFYYAVLFPAILSAAGVPPRAALGGLVTNEFYRLDGLKFSTSRNHAIWGHELLDGADPGLVRLFLSWDRPAPHSSNFTLAAFEEFTARWRAVAESLPADAGARTGSLPSAEVVRAAQALHPEHFDAALAVRCLLPAAERGDRDAGRLLGLITG